MNRLFVLSFILLIGCKSKQNHTLYVQYRSKAYFFDTMAKLVTQNYKSTMEGKAMADSSGSLEDQQKYAAQGKELQSKIQLYTDSLNYYLKKADSVK